MKKCIWKSFPDLKEAGRITKTPTSPSLRPTVAFVIFMLSLSRSLHTHTHTHDGFLPAPFDGSLQVWCRFTSESPMVIQVLSVVPIISFIAKNEFLFFWFRIELGIIHCIPPLFVSSYGRILLYVSPFFSFFFCHPMTHGVPAPAIWSELQLPQLWEHWILNPLCRAWDPTCIPALPRHHQSHCATVGTPCSLCLLWLCEIFAEDMPVIL